MTYGTTQSLTECLLGASSSATGKISGQGVVRVEGQFEGSIQAGDAVIISKNAKVKAEISAKDVFIAGEFSGTIEAAGIVHIANRAVVTAKIQAKGLDLAAGAFFDGNFKRSAM